MSLGLIITDALIAPTKLSGTYPRTALVRADEAPHIGEHTQDGAVVVRSRTRRHRLQVPRSDGKMRSAADGISVSVFGGFVLALSTSKDYPERNLLR
ncbi:MAG TPA: hypothetical protein VEG65_01520 [Candidatus Bathyarchaeia archaeon]|nr:hypothetical protein [Candidatus Bathyarchaeia archaeon]